MKDDALQQYARELAEELPGARSGHSFGPDWEVFKIRDKVFMLITDITGEPLVIIKADPEYATMLRNQHKEITPGYHMNKRHWITLHSGGALRKKIVDDLVTDSYLLVVGSLSRANRPIDPETFLRSKRL